MCSTKSADRKVKNGKNILSSLLLYPLDNSQDILSRFYQQFIRSTNNVTNSGIRNQNSKYLHATCFREKEEISSVLSFSIARNISITNSNTYSEPLIQWVSLERSLQCVNNIEFQPLSKRAKERKTNPVSFFFATIVDNNCLFIPRRLAFEQSLSAEFEVHEGPLLSAAVSQLVATSHPNLIFNTTIALFTNIDF